MIEYVPLKKSALIDYVVIYMLGGEKYQATVRAISVIDATSKMNTSLCNQKLPFEILSVSKDE